jgi:hypothetical protein
MQLVASESVTLRTGALRIEASGGSTSAPTIHFAKSRGGSGTSDSNAAVTTDGNWVLTQVRYILIASIAVLCSSIALTS